jgi:hypothetical protein
MIIGGTGRAASLYETAQNMKGGEEDSLSGGDLFSFALIEEDSSLV